MKDLQVVEDVENTEDIEYMDGLIRYIVVSDFAEYMAKCSLDCDVRVVVALKGEKGNTALSEVLKVCERGQEIEIESIINAFSTALEFIDTINEAIKKGVVIKTRDGGFSTEDVEDVPAIGYLLQSIENLLGSKQDKDIYPIGFSEVISKYMNKNITEAEARNKLGIQRAQFYRLLKKVGANRRGNGKEDIL